MATPRNEITDPNLEGFDDEAFAEPGPDGLTQSQLAARVALKREQAEQDAGWRVPPGHEGDAEVEPLPDEYKTKKQEPPKEKDSGEVLEEEAQQDDDVSPDEDASASPEEEPEEPEEPTAEEEEDDFYVGRYKSKEAAEEALAEKDRTIARLFRERWEQEAEKQQPQQPQQGEPQLDVPAWQAWAEEAIEQGAGTEGALEALKVGGPQAYDLYISQWIRADDEESRAEAIAFNNEVQRQFAAEQARKAVEPVVTNYQNISAPHEAEAAKQFVAQRYPDFNEMSDEMDRLVREPGALDEETKTWLSGMAAEGVKGKARAWEYLYLQASASRSPRRAEATKVERQRRKTSGDEAKLAATVSSSEGSASHTPLSEADLAVIRKKNGIRRALNQPLLPEE